MAEEILVESKLRDGERLIQELRSKQFDVSMACWIEEESGLWYLYLASKDVDANGTAGAYEKLSLALQQISTSTIDPFEIKLIGTAHPLTKEVFDLHRKYPAPLHTRYRLHELGGMSIGEAHIYPPIGPTS